jgi:peroxiredoxin
MAMNKIGAGLFLLLVAVAGAFVMRPTVVPDLAMTTIKGVPIALKALRGKPVMVTFWSTNCPSCLKEIPDLLALYQDYHPKGFELIAVSMSYDPPSHVVAMSEAKQLTYPVVMDLDSSYAAAFGHVEFTPSTFLLDPDGRIIARYIGLFDVEEIKKLLEPFLKG